MRSNYLLGNTRPKVAEFPAYEIWYLLHCLGQNYVLTLEMAETSYLAHASGWHLTQMVQGRHVIQATPFQLLGNTEVQMSGMSRCKPITLKVINILSTLPSSSWWNLVTRVTLGNRLERVTWQRLVWNTWQNYLRRVFKRSWRSFLVNYIEATCASELKLDYTGYIVWN